MIHFLFLLLFAAAAAVAFGVFYNGTARAKVLHGAKVFAQFVGICLLIAWICYFLPV